MQSGVGGQRFAPHGYKDIWAAILFLLHLGFVIALAVINAKELGKGGRGGTGTASETNSETFGKAVGFIVGMAGFGILFGAVILFLLRKFATQFIWTSNILYCVLLLASGFYIGISGSWLYGILTMILAALIIFWLFTVRGRIPFASALLSTSSHVVWQYPALIFTAFCFVVLNILFCILFGLASYRWIKKDQPVPYPIAALLLLSFYWTNQVLQNIVHTTTCGTVATWYFNYTAAHNPTAGALQRTCTTSFGSVCFGSLIVAIIRTVRVLLESQARNENSFIACCVACLLGWIEGLVEYFNQYAYAHVAIYGKAYVPAAKSAWRMIKDCGILAIINDSLVDTVFLFAGLFAGIFGAAVFGLIAWGASMPKEWIIFAAVAGGLIAMTIVNIFTSIVGSAVMTIFVCYAEQPEALQLVNPDLYTRITAVAGMSGVDFSGGAPAPETSYEEPYAQPSYNPAYQPQSYPPQPYPQQAYGQPQAPYSPPPPQYPQHGGYAPQQYPQYPQQGGYPQQQQGGYPQGGYPPGGNQGGYGKV